MKIATWNVNGVRARQAQLREWMERDRPDVVCLQELKAEASQIPEQVKLEDYHAYWHGFRAYSGASESRASSGSGGRSASCSTSSSPSTWWTSAARGTPTIRTSSPGGRR